MGEWLTRRRGASFTPPAADGAWSLTRFEEEISPRESPSKVAILGDDCGARASDQGQTVKVTPLVSPLPAIGCAGSRNQNCPWTTLPATMDGWPPFAR